MEQKVHRIKCGNGNCYIVEGKGSILVDTARTKYREMLLEECREKDVKLILLTHTHMDHCQNAKYLAQQLNVPIAICQPDKELIADNMRQPLKAKTLLGKLVLGISLDAFKHDYIELFEPDIFLSEGDNLEAYGIDATVIGLPGHTKGSIGLDIKEEGIIVGDALMNMFYPTVSMLYHDHDEMTRTAQKIAGMGDRLIYFGHGKPVKNKDWVK